MTTSQVSFFALNIEWEEWNKYAMIEDDEASIELGDKGVSVVRRFSCIGEVVSAGYTIVRGRYGERSMYDCEEEVFEKSCTHMIIIGNMCFVGTRVV